MPAEKFVQYDRANAVMKEKAGAEAGGSTNAGRLPALDSDGRLAQTMMPAGFGVDTQIIEASEALSAGDAVNIHVESGNLRVRKADASAVGTAANGFVLQAFTDGEDATVYMRGANNQVSGLTVGDTVYLSETAGGITTTAPTTAGSIVQALGFSVAANQVEFHAEPPIVLA